MPRWIHARAEHLLAKNPSMRKDTAFAIATQQAHATGKAPKEKGWGTPEGKAEAKDKYDRPKKDYIKTPNPGNLDSPKLAEALYKLGYKLQGHTDVQGLRIAIENRKGSVRKGTDSDGNEWRTKMKHPYGYIKGTRGADGEPVDAYVGPDKDAPKAYVVHQHKDDGKGYDEDKVMLGFKSKADAKRAYLEHYDDPKFLGPISIVSVERLKELVQAKKKLVKISSFSDELEKMSGVSQIAKRLAKRVYEAENPLEVAGLGMLAAPAIDEIQAKLRSKTPKEQHKKRFLPESLDAPIEAGGLGILAAPIIASRIHHGSWKLAASKVQGFTDETHSPKQRLAITGKVGEPKILSHGPSISDKSKPKGYGEPLPGTTKHL